MPPVAAYVTATLVAASVNTVVATIISQLVVSMLTNVVLGAVSKALTSKPKQREASATSVTARDRTLAVRQPITVHRVIYGQARVSGPYTFIHSTDSGQYLNFVLTLAGHAVEEIGDIYFNDELIPLDGSGNATGRFAGYATVKKGLGTTAGDADLLTALQANCPGVWTANHKQTGRAKLYVRLKFSQDLFPNGIPNVTSIVKGKQLYDPRTGLTVYSNNAALCVRDYIASSAYGIGEPAARIYDASFTAAANVCDENVALAAGGTEKRYTCNGTIDTDRKPKDVLESLLTAMAGKAAYQGGKWNVYAGAYRTPTVSLSEDDLDGPIKLTTRLSRREIFNGVKGVYVSPADFYQPTDFPPVTNATYLSEDQGERIWKDIDLQFTTSAATAQRLAKIELERARQQMTTIWPCNLKALRIQAGDVVNLNNTRFGWVNKPFEVEDWQFALRDGGDAPRLGIDLYMRETASAVYDWNSGEETTVDPAPDTTLPNPFTVSTPGIPSVTESLYVTRGLPKARATVTWAAVDTFAVHYQVEHKLAAASDWIIAPRTTSTTLDIDDIAAGVYQFRVKAINTIGVSSAYAGPTTKEIYGLGAKPSALTNLTIQAAGGLAILQWSQHPDDDVVYGGHIAFRHSASESGASYSATVSIGDALPGSQTAAVLPLLPGTYFAVAVDSSGIASDPVSASTSGAQVLAFSPLGTVSEHPSFAGTNSGTAVVDGVLKLGGASLIDSWGMIDDIADWDSEGGVNSTGTYTFATGIDLGVQKRVRLRVTKVVQEVNTRDLIDSRTALMDDWPSFDGVVGGATDMQVWARATNDDPAGSPVWGAWEKLHAGEYYVRAFQFQARLSSVNTDYNIQVTELSVTAEAL